MKIGIGLGLGFNHGGGGTPPATPLCDAIARRVCVTATHKGKSLKLAPHIVYPRRGERTLDALLLETNGKAANEDKLTTYTVADLTDISVTSDPFEPSPGFDPNEPEYLIQPKCVVETVQGAHYRIKSPLGIVGSGGGGERIEAICAKFRMPTAAVKGRGARLATHSGIIIPLEFGESKVSIQICPLV